MVGSHLLDYLVEKTDWNIYGLRRWRSSTSNIQHHFDKDYFHSRVNLIEGDLLDSQSLLRVMKISKPDYIFHLAAQSFPTSSFIMPIQTLDTNVLGTARLLEAIRNSNLNPWVHICSSSEVFGQVKKQDLPINEYNKYQPASPYAISKIGADLLSIFYAEAYQIKTISTRMFTHTGPRRSEVFAESSFAKQIALIEIGAIPPVVNVGNLNSVRTWADVRDAVRAYYILLTKDPNPGEVYNIGGNFTCTIGDMLNHLISISTFKGKIKVVENRDLLRPLDADLQIPDITKFVQKTGWAPKYTFAETMNDLMDYWRSSVINHKFETFWR